MSDITVDMLAKLLQLSKRTIERALYIGEIVPTSRTRSGRARFDAEYSGTLQRRVDEQRARGRKHGMLRWAIVSDPLLMARRQPKNQPTAEEWVKQMLWKRRNLFPHSPTNSEPEPAWSPDVAAARMRETIKKSQEQDREETNRRISQWSANIRRNRAPQPSAANPRGK
jgi:hypothetical protein